MLTKEQIEVWVKDIGLTLGSYHANQCLAKLKEAALLGLRDGGEAVAWRGRVNSNKDGSGLWSDWRYQKDEPLGDNSDYFVKEPLGVITRPAADDAPAEILEWDNHSKRLRESIADDALAKRLRESVGAVMKIQWSGTSDRMTALHNLVQDADKAAAKLGGKP